MPTPSIRNVSEAVALVSVVLGLVFVGLEIRNNTAVARAESRRELAEQNIDFLMQVALDDEANRLWSQDWTLGWFESLSPTERTRIQSIAVALILRLENVYLQYEEGVLDEAALASYGMVQPKTFEPWFEVQWDAIKELRDPDFVRYFESVHDYSP